MSKAEEEHEDDALLLYPEDAIGNRSKSNGDDSSDSDNEEDNKPDDDDSVDTVMTEKYQPECHKANSLSFYHICKRLETLWTSKRDKIKQTELEKKLCLLPPIRLLKWIQPESIFPLMRLLVPDQDNIRNCKMKESRIAEAYCGVLNATKGNPNYKMLYNYTDPQAVPHKLAGDLSLVVEHVMERLRPSEPSGFVLGQINEYLDELAAIGRSTHHWRETGNSKQKKPNQKELRIRWLRKLEHALSPLEHKWLVRILLQKMEFGLGWRSLFSYYSPYALDLWNANNSLKDLCDRLASPEYHNERQAEERAFEQGEGEDAASAAARLWDPQGQPAVLGNLIAPMLSCRTTFENCIEKLQGNHSKYLEMTDGTESRNTNADGTPRMSLKFPAICAEIKVDGERMVMHITREGVVTMNTRSAKWYSQIYSPVLGPSIRKAVHGRYPNVEVILDGEVCAWDDGRNEFVPFGSNRTVANGRKEYLSRHNLLDKRDLNLHADTKASNIMRSAEEFKFVRQSAQRIVREDDEGDPGKECWLQFLVFDILYVGGPDAKRLFDDCGFDTNNKDKFPRNGGSVVHLPLLQRKQILYQLIEEQPKEVEFCQAIVVRPNGNIVDGREYFQVENPLIEFNRKITLLDSTQATIKGEISELDEIDRRRYQSKSSNEIGQTRAQAIDDFYRKVVEENKFEGLVLKDVASPYIFGDPSRKRSYWQKFKPDYDKGTATDIDVVIVGAYFATGMRHSGELNHYLCACVDSKHPNKYMTVCNVNGGSVRFANLAKIMQATGFARASENNGGIPTLGKWFQQDGDDPLPDFISSRSLQFKDYGDENDDGWKFNRSKNYPDLWIHPEDSVVLTIYGQELVQSEDYSAGITLRFARIDKIRLESVDGDEKPASEVDTEHDLWIQHIDSQRQGVIYTSQDISADTLQARSRRRFLTPEENSRRRTKKRKGKPLLSPSKQIPKVEASSQALAGLYFTVLEGNYGLDSNSLEAQEGREEGWFDEAAVVRNKEDVMKFIKKHSGTIWASPEECNETLFILGGVTSDRKVQTIMKGIEIAKSQVVDKPKTKKAIRNKNLSVHDGILKWTFAFSLVHQQQLKAGESPLQSLPLLSNGKPVPKAHHYLERSKSVEGVPSDILALDNLADATKAELMMALMDIDSRRNNEENEVISPWQSRGSEVSALDRSVLSCFNDNPFWPRHHSSEMSSIEATNGDECILLYPDVFENGSGTEDCAMDDLNAVDVDSKRWEEDDLEDTPHHILSVLPIASAMGAIVTIRLNSSVTHILCALKKVDGQNNVLNLASATSNHFDNPERGGELLDHLRSIHFGKGISLVHPDWVRRTWTQNKNEMSLD